MDTDRMLVWLRETLDAAELAARRASELCGCHPAAPSWTFDDEKTDGRILVGDDPHPTLKRKIGRRWNGSYEGLFMAEHIVRHDPAAVLRRITADRQILEAHPIDTQIINPGYGKHVADFGCTTCHDWDGVTEGYGWCDTVRLLAEGYGWTEETTGSANLTQTP